MKIITATLTILLLAVCAYGASYTASQSGNWNSASTWGGSGIPGSGDTAVLGSYTVTVPSGYTATVGASGATGTTAITGGSGGSLIVAGTLNLRGDLLLGTNSLSVSGALNINPPDGSLYKIQWSGASSFTLQGSSGSPAVLAVVPQNSTGAGWVDAYDNGSGTVTPALNYAKVVGLGTASQRAMDFRSSPSSSGATVISHTLFKGAGTVSFTNAAGSATLSAVDFRNCIDTSSTGNGASCAEFSFSSSNQTVQQLTAYNPSPSTIWFFGNPAQCGSSTAPCFNGYNTSLYRTTGSTTNAFFVFDSAGGLTTTTANSGASLTNSVAYSHKDNPHYFGENGNNGGASNTYQGNLCDGDNYAQTSAGDTGDFVLPNAGVTIKNNILINNCGTLFTAGESSEAVTALNNTEYWNWGAAIGETQGGAGQVTAFRNNLFVNPSTNVPSGEAALSENGIHQDSDFVTQTLAAGMLDYNAFWQMPGSGDSGASSTTQGNLTNAALGGTVSYVGGATFANWFTSATYGTTSGYGTHDIHANPQFVNAGWNLCSWYMGLIGNSSYSCATNNHDETALLGVAQAIVSLNGCDYQGNAAAYDSRFSAAAALAAATAAYTPQNSALKATGSPLDGSPDIGAVTVSSSVSTTYPSLIQGSIRSGNIF